MTMNQSISFTLGADPEVFLGKGKSVRSAIDRVGGSKAMPMPLPIGDGFAVQEDGVAVEFNIPPAKDRDTFIKNIHAGYSFLEEVIGKTWKFNFIKDSAVSFPACELEDPRAWEFGCEPDYNAWTNKVNPKPRAMDRNLRSCGGHVHVGYNFPNNEAKLKFIQFMDLYAGVPSQAMDSGVERRKLYGKMGAFRPTSFGVEYRVLSNFWIFSAPHTGWVYDQTSRALDAMQNNTINIREEEDLIRQAINENDSEVASFLVNKYNLDVVHVH